MTMNQFSRKVKDACWDKLDTIPTLSPRFWRYGSDGRPLSGLNEGQRGPLIAEYVRVDNTKGYTEDNCKVISAATATGKPIRNYTIEGLQMCSASFFRDINEERLLKEVARVFEQERKGEFKLKRVV